MLCHGRLTVFLFATLVGTGVARECIAGYRRGPLRYQQSQVEARPIERAIVSTRTRDSVITITNTGGKLRGGDNDFCVLLETRDTREPLDVQNAGVDFTLLVGRIQEEPTRTQLTQNQVGRYCGRVNLGKQYYVPASYYVFALQRCRRAEKEGTPVCDSEIVNPQRVLPAAGANRN